MGRVGGGGGDEVEGHVLGAGRVLEDGENGGHGAADVSGVQGHGDVDGLAGADDDVVVVVLFFFIGVEVIVVDGGDGRAVGGVVELRSFSELLGGGVAVKLGRCRDGQG